MYARQGKNKTTYYLEARIGSDITGKYRKVYKTVHDINGKRALKRAMLEFQNEIDAGIVKRKSGVSLCEMLERMLSVIEMSAKETTIGGYKAIIKRVKTFSIANAKADLIQTSDMQDFVAELREHRQENGKPYSSKTIKSTISFISNCYDLAINADLVSQNPCQGIRLPKAEKSTAKSLNLDELPQFLMNLNSLDPDIKVAFELALFLGLRRSEICGLKWEHIHEDYISIEETRHKVSKDGKWVEVVSDTKTKGSEAYIALPDFLKQDIDDLREYHKSQANFFGRHYDADPEYVILSTYGKKINPSRFYDELQKYIKRLGIDHVTFHQLRHTYASLVNYLGADIVELASQMRHSNANITLSTYTHLVRSVPASSRKYAKEMDELRDEFVGKMSENEIKKP